MKLKEYLVNEIVSQLTKKLDKQFLCENCKSMITLDNQKLSTGKVKLSTGYPQVIHRLSTGIEIT
jgi:hypothetical protein